jgi:hypothetical protein
MPGTSVVLKIGDGAPNARWEYYEGVGPETKAIPGPYTVGFAWRGVKPELVIDENGACEFKFPPGSNASIADFYLTELNDNE